MVTAHCSLWLAPLCCAEGGVDEANWPWRERRRRDRRHTGDLRREGRNALPGGCDGGVDHGRGRRCVGRRRLEQSVGAGAHPLVRELGGDLRVGFAAEEVADERTVWGATGSRCAIARSTGVTCSVSGDGETELGGWEPCWSLLGLLSAAIRCSRTLDCVCCCFC